MKKIILFTIPIIAVGYFLWHLAFYQEPITKTQWAWCLNHLSVMDQEALKLGFDYQPSVVIYAVISSVEDTNFAIDNLMKDQSLVRICSEAVKSS